MKTSAYETIKEKQKNQIAGKPQTLQATPKNDQWEAYLSYFKNAPKDTTINQGINDVFEIVNRMKRNGSYAPFQLHAETVCTQDLNKIEGYLKELKQILVGAIAPFNLSYMDKDALLKLTEHEKEIRNKLESSIVTIDSNRVNILEHAISIAKVQKDIDSCQIRAGLSKIKTIAESANSEAEKAQLLSVVSYLEHIGLQPLEGP